VRWHTAEGLVAGRDRRGVPALIELLDRGPFDLACQAEALLAQLAGDRAPTVPLGSEESARRRCRAAWDAWWRDRGGQVDLARLELDSRVLGLRLVVANGGYGGAGAVWEYGADRRQRWQLKNLGGPFDARVLPGGRLLLAEYNLRRVTERDLKGN